MEGCGAGPGQREGAPNQGTLGSGVPCSYLGSSECTWASVCVVFVNVALDLYLTGLMECIGQEPGWGLLL